MNKQIARLGAALLLLYVLLFMRTNIIQVFNRDALVNNPVNTRTIIADFGRERGQIVTADGVVIAESRETGGQLERQRVYPTGDRYGHITGYFAFNYGSSGLERTYNDELAGRENPVPMRNMLDLLAPQEGSADLHLNIRDDLTQVAQAQLGQRKGSVVVLNPQTGAVYTLVSWPTYDPNAISNNDLAAAQQAWEALNADEGNPALARSYREVFPPGSTFKIVTAATALQDGRATPSEPVWPQETSYTPPLTTSPISNYAGETCGGTLPEAVRDSCNSVFAQLGAERLGPKLMTEGAEKMGFNDVPPLDIPDGAASRFPTDFGAKLETNEYGVDIVENTPAIAQSAIGQFEVAATPLQMALVASAVASDGKIHKPYIVNEVISSEGELIKRNEPEVWKEAMSPEHAAELRQMMYGVVSAGTATALQTPGLEVGAKTGTAQTTAGAIDDTHAWIIAFAGRPGQAPELAMAVIVEAVAGQGQKTGGGVAAPIGQAILQQWLASG